MDKELIEKAEKCKSAEEIIALAKEKGVEMSEAEAKNYFAMLNKQSGEVSDNELASVSGGCTTHNADGYVVVMYSNSCSLYKPKGGSGNGRCGDCKYISATTDWIGHCTIRKKGNDPIND